MITIKGDRWPQVVIHFRGELTDEEFEAYLAEYENYLERRERYAAILITEPHSPMTKPRHAKLQTEWIAAHEQEIRSFCVGLAFVLPSVVMRGALRAMLWMQPLPVPYRVFATVPEGFEWTQAILGEAGLEVPQEKASG